MSVPEKFPAYRKGKYRRLGRPLINVETGLDRVGDIRNRNSVHFARQRVIDSPYCIEIGGESIGDRKFVAGIGRECSAYLNRRCATGGRNDGNASGEVDQSRSPIVVSTTIVLLVKASGGT